MTPAAQQASASTKPFWIAFAGLGAALLLIYAPVLMRLVQQWSNDEDMGHGFFVPVVAAYIVWQKRPVLSRIQPEPCWWGLALIALGAVQLQAGSLGAELFLTRTALLESIAGLVLFLAGKRMLRAIAFPMFLLCFMIPIPAIVYTRITFPLQLLASKVAETALHGLGIPVLRNGNVLELPKQTLSVVEACSGIRSLLSLAFLSLVYGHFFEKRGWLRVTLFLAAVPIAITANAFRVTMTGVLAEYQPGLAEGFFHTAEGWLIFMIALALLFGLHAVLGKLIRPKGSAR